jgi:hypothetical protein
MSVFPFSVEDINGNGEDKFAFFHVNYFNAFFFVILAKPFLFEGENLCLCFLVSSRGDFRSILKNDLYFFDVRAALFCAL